MAARLFTPTLYPLVDLDPKSPSYGLVTSQWRRYQEAVTTALTPGAINELLTSDGTNFVWQKLKNANIDVAAAIAYSKLNLALSIGNGDVAAAAAIDWTKISKVGSSIADLATRSASDLNTGTLGATQGGATRLLYANSGTDTNAAATTVDSIALSGLTAKDTIRVEVTIDSVTQQTARPLLYHVTDGAILLDLHSAAGALPAARTTAVQCTLRQRQSSNLAIVGYTLGLDGAGNAVANDGAWNKYAATAAWTAAWTLGLRHGGVTAGGTFQYAWAVFKIAGQ